MIVKSYLLRFLPYACSERPTEDCYPAVIAARLLGVLLGMTYP